MYYTTPESFPFSELSCLHTPPTWNQQSITCTIYNSPYSAYHLPEQGNSKSTGKGVGWESLFRASAHVCKGTMLHGFKQKRSRARRCTLRSTARSRRRDKSIFIGISKRCGTYHRDWLAGRPPMKDHNTVGQNNQESRLQYWATRSSVCSFARTAHSLSLLHPARFARALRCAHSFARSLTSLTPSLVGQ